MTRPGIDLLAAPPSAVDLVLLAHGGEVKSLEDAHDWRGAILRMWPFAAAVRDVVPEAAVGLLRYRYRGWNGKAAHPAADLRTVLDELPDRIQRIVLIGHSMGGRAVLAAGNHPKVVGILGLAPWLPPGEPIAVDAELPRTIVLAHGSEDRITDPRLTAAYARRLRAAGLPVGLLTVENETHAMLRRYADWNDLVRRFTQHTFTPDHANSNSGDGDTASRQGGADDNGNGGQGGAAGGRDQGGGDGDQGDGDGDQRGGDGDGRGGRGDGAGGQGGGHSGGDQGSDGGGGRGDGDPGRDDCAAVLSTEADRVDQLPRWNRPASTSAAVRAITLARLRLRPGGAL